jgi:glutamate-1-semialdehyde 2,1-aminomutase
VTRVGSLTTLFFRDTAPADGAEALASDREAFGRCFGTMLDRGVLLPPSQFEAWFLSLAHGEAELETIVQAAGAAFRA